MVTVLVVATSTISTAQQSVRWKEARYEVVSGHEVFKTAWLGYVFAGEKNCIVKVADELNGLMGIKLPVDYKADHQPLKIKFSEPVKLLIGIFRDEANSYRRLSEKKDQQLMLKNAVTVTGLPPVDVYAVEYKKGTHTIDPEGSGSFIVLGVIRAAQPISVRDAGMPDGRAWQPFIAEGFYNSKPLFEVIDGPDKPVLDEGMPGTEGIQGGFEGGMCVKIGDTYHMFPTERAGESDVAAYYDRVKTRIGHWTSKDAIHWARQSTIYQASGTYAITEEDNPLNDRRGAIWSYMPVFSEKANRWYGYYLAYTVHKEIDPNHSFGRIWRTESVKEGIDGIGGPYKDAAIIMEPGLDTQLWEGRQGVDSFFPFRAGDEWLGFYGGAYPFDKREDYPHPSRKAWYVGLARSKSLEGPWTRLDTTINPVTSIHPFFIENPIVYKLPNGLFITVFDGGPEAWGLHLPNMMGYSLSNDGYHWTEAHYLPIQTQVKQWWNIMRTPVCLIPEGNDVYTILYAAIDTSKRFHPMGMVKVKLNKNVLDSITIKD